MLAELFARILARRLVRWGLIALFNLIGFTSVVGIPVAVIIDVLLLLAALQGIFAALRGTAVVVGRLTAKLFKVAAIGVAVCAVVGVAAAIVIPHFAPPQPVQTVQAAPTTQVSQEAPATNLTEPPAAQTQTQTPAPVRAAGAREVIALIDDRDYAGALALIDAGADSAGAVDGRTPLTALELDHRPTYYSEPDAYRLMKTLIARNDGLDRRLDDFGSILWHRLMYELANDPQKFAEVLDILLARGVDINQKNFHGQTLADTQMWPYAVQDIMIAHGACGHAPNPVRPQQPVCPA